MITADRPLVFRAMTLDDLPVIVELERAIYPQPWSEGIFIDELSRHDRIYVVAEADGEIVAFGGLMVVHDDAHVTTLAVRPEARHRGLGSRLMLQLIQAGLERGTRNLTLEVRSTNIGAQRLYEKFDMAAVGLRKHYYRDDDAVIMWVTDIDRPEYAERLREIAAGVEEAS
ncbi:MAG: ribosomal protein S18-alanine N-acetyltransferase [Acidimicrobiia bacterium]|nr:ribosomal protein S18-alanine N-acetyltransferase [Acidimicrobiia bacterium]